MRQSCISAQNYDKSTALTITQSFSYLGYEAPQFSVLFYKEWATHFMKNYDILYFHFCQHTDSFYPPLTGGIIAISSIFLLSTSSSKM